MAMRMLIPRAAWPRPILALRQATLKPRCIASSRLFHSLQVASPLLDRLNKLGFSTPTSAQRLAIPSILQGHDVVIAAETGGGKTLAYLVPLVQQLQQLQTQSSQQTVEVTTNPVAVILTASQELVSQVADVLAKVDPVLAQEAIVAADRRGVPGIAARWKAKARTPIWIATPRVLLRALQPRELGTLRHIVIDEADLLLTGGFEREVKQFLGTVRNLHFREKEKSCQTIFSAATIPNQGTRSTERYLQHYYPDAVHATTENFHKTLPKLEISTHDLDAFIAQHKPENGSADSPCSEEQQRMELLWTILQEDVATRNDGGSTLIFAKSAESAASLHRFLTMKRGMDCALFHKHVPKEDRRSIHEQLSTPRTNDQPPLVVVATDLAARGLDTTRVQHVIQYEFAGDVVSYLHRVGRTARAGTRGKVSSIVSKQNQLVLDKIREAGEASLEDAFSRKRSLRKKHKKQLAQTLQSADISGLAPSK